MKANKRFFAKNWNYPIRWYYEALLPYINYRSEQAAAAYKGAAPAYGGYKKLYRRATRKSFQRIAFTIFWIVLIAFTVFWIVLFLIAIAICFGCNDLSAEQL
jgi:hypothetical protein